MINEQGDRKMGTIISITTALPELQQQARVALTAHYTKKGLKGDELTQTVDRCLAVQFKPRPVPADQLIYTNEKEARKALANTKRRIANTKRRIADAERENVDLLREWEPVNQLIN
jgi:hypothetical protein